jgi:hypothetical protein
MNPKRRILIMWKKTMLLFGMSALLLIGCTDQDDDMVDQDQDMMPGSNDEKNSLKNASDEEDRLEDDDVDIEDTSGNE